MIDPDAFFKITYGLYIVCAGDQTRGNGFVSNTVMQVSSEPPLFTICSNKNNATTELIQKQGAFSVSVLGQDAPSELIATFGYQSGKQVDKMQGMTLRYGETGVPMLLDGSIAILEFRCLQTIDAGSHLMFVGELMHSELLDKRTEPMTYAYYRSVRKGSSPKNAPTYLEEIKAEVLPDAGPLNKYRCGVCGYVYEDTLNEKFDDLPDEWTCPICGYDKSVFDRI